MHRSGTNNPGINAINQSSERGRRCNRYCYNQYEYHESISNINNFCTPVLCECGGPNVMLLSDTITTITTISVSQCSGERSYRSQYNNVDHEWRPPVQSEDTEFPHQRWQLARAGEDNDGGGGDYNTETDIIFRWMFSNKLSCMLTSSDERQGRPGSMFPTQYMRWRLGSAQWSHNMTLWQAKRGLGLGYALSMRQPRSSRLSSCLELVNKNFNYKKQLQFCLLKVRDWWF